MRSIVVLLCLLVCTHELGAQDAAPPLSALSVELTLGPTYTRSSGAYVEPSESALWGDVLVAVRLRSLGGGFLLAGVDAATRVTPRAVESICRIDPRGGCTPNFPVFRLVGASVGWESARATRRLLLGPTRADSDVAGASLGWQVRGDLAADFTRHVAAMVGVRATLVPDHRGDGFGIYGGRVGIRLR
jgi:hypothetical protein